MPRNTWLRYALPILGVFALTLFLVARFLRPAPPTTISISTGREDGAYHQFAGSYRAELAKHGITLTAKPSLGSIENLARLRDPAQAVDIAFVQGGLGYLTLTPQTAAVPDVALETLATVTYEPVWIFTKDSTRNSILDLAGLKLGVGPEGSGTRKVALDLLQDAGVARQALSLSTLTGLEGVKAFKAGELDALILVASPKAPAIVELLLTPEAHLVSLSQGQALSRRVPYLTPILFPQGVFDIKANNPPRDVTLLTTTANLVMRNDLHPAIAYLLLDIASTVHSAPGLLSRPGEFPSSRSTDFPLAEESKRFFAHGRPFFHRHLPFWLASLAERMLIVLIPMFAILIPILRSVPDLYRWRMENKLYRWYGELMKLEREMFANQIHEAEIPKHISSLNQMERDAIALELPIDYSDKVYTLRQHIDYVRARLNNTSSTPPRTSVGYNP